VTADPAAEGTTRALVLHPDIRSDPARRAPGPALAEAVALAAALPRLAIAGAETVPLPKPRAGWLFGSGKLEELKARIAAAEAELVLIDGPVTPVQQRNLEKHWGVKVLDRTGLILEIFADRARTREGVLQVDLAALAYQRTRLVRSWTHLERQRGGLGFVGGPGETQIEADRRAIDEQMMRLRRQLAKVSQTRGLHRAARARTPWPVVALVGYTNAGKSTLFNQLTGAEVLAKDMLFATLDPTMRALRLPSGQEVIMSDTVGFISALPTQLVAAFRATLEEVLEADLVVHVRDIAHPDSEAQADDVRAILAELGLGAAQTEGMIEVWNKIDALPEAEADALRGRAARLDGVVVASALSGEGLDALQAMIAARLPEPVQEEDLDLGFGEGRRRAWLFAQGVVLSEARGEDGHHLHVRWTGAQKARFARL